MKHSFRTFVVRWRVKAMLQKKWENGDFVIFYQQLLPPLIQKVRNKSNKNV
jgi:hypothetical protein